MPIVKLRDAGAAGLNQDLPAHEIADQAWSSGRNVRFHDGMIARTQGHSAQFGALNNAPYGAYFAVSSAGNKYIVYPGLTRINAVRGTTHYNITRTVGGDYAATADKKWTGGVLTGNVVVNNGVDDPQYWVPQDGGNMAPLPAWPASTKCGALRVFRDYLVALDITKSGTRYPYRVKWSAAASSGSLPSSWDETSTTNDAGEYDLGDSLDFLVDALPFADSLAIYREQSIYLMRWIGGNSIMSFQRVVPDLGMLANNCAASFPGGHVVLGQGDVFVFDGSPNTRSIVNGRMQKWLFSRIDSTNFRRSFVVHNKRDSEVWVCFPQTGATACDTALVWNYRFDTMTVRDLPSATCGVYAQIDQTKPQVIDDLTGVIDSLTGTIDSYGNETSLAESRLVLGTTNSKLMVVDEAQTFDGTNIVAFVERTGIALGDAQRVKLIRQIWPQFDGIGSVEISVGTSMAADEPTNWSGAVTYTIGSSRKIDVDKAGRFIGLRIRSSGSGAWRLRSVDVDVVPMGLW